MRLLSLSLEQLRNYGKADIDLSGSSLHLFVGPNGSGKTNLLEAISILSLTKSFLQQEEQDVMQWEKEFYRVRAAVRADSGEEGKLEVVSQFQPKKEKGCFRNDVRLSISEMVGQLPSVMFLPQDLTLFLGSPSERRRFLDQLLCQVLPEYFQALVVYQKLLKQRNALLRSIAQRISKPADLAPWDHQVAEQGSLLTLARLELLETFGLTLPEELRALGEPWHEIEIVYERDGVSRDRAALTREFVTLLEQHRDRDILLQSTTVGPHREDWHLKADGHELSTFASRGQQRIAVLALLFLEASYLELRRGEKPVILLDDIFSELDAEHQANVFTSLADHQVLMTATHVPEGALGAQVWEVENGKVMKERKILPQHEVRTLKFEVRRKGKEKV